MDVRCSGYGDISCIDNEADGYIWFYLPPYKTDNISIETEIRDYINKLELILTRMDPIKPIIVFTMELIYKINYQTIKHDIDNMVIDYNQKIFDLAQNSNNIKIVDIRDFCQRFPLVELVDWKYYWMSLIPVNPKLIPAFSQWLKRQLEILEMKRKKCIIVDLDNTLWSGILGEDGIDGIKMGEDYPGNAFRFFQFWLLELGRAGIILTICSKNNEDDVLAVWEHHPDILLKKEHIVTYRINWNNKADNIQDIARELNIGLDSMVFIDDSPEERELIKQLLPQVAVPDFPKYPYLYPDFIRNLMEMYFCVYKLTDEDFAKTQTYKENAERGRHRTQFSDMEAYLRSLDITLTIEKLDKFNITRFAQMTQKTNQFNLTTKRYTEFEIQNFAKNEGLVYGLRVKDKFGDNGITGLIIVEVNNKKAVIDTFLLSCRILGKDIEKVFIRYILFKMRILCINDVEAFYMKTAKNQMVECFYESIGFTVTNITDSQKNYFLDIKNYEYEVPNIYDLEDICVKE